jgi:hypothetical protein
LHYACGLLAIRAADFDSFSRKEGRHPVWDALDVTAPIKIQRGLASPAIMHTVMTITGPLGPKLLVIYANGETPVIAPP